MSNLTWSDAIDLAFEPTDLDRKLGTRGVFGTGEPIIGESGEVQDPNLVRERATHHYAKAHEGEQVTVEYVDPASANDGGSRLVYRSHGELRNRVGSFVTYPVFQDGGITKSEKAIIVGSHAIPLNGISSIRTADDRSVCVL